MFQRTYLNILVFTILALLLFSFDASAQQLLRKKKVLPSVKLGLSDIMLPTSSISIRSGGGGATKNLSAPLVMPYFFWEKIAFVQFGFEVGFSPMAYQSTQTQFRDQSGELNVAIDTTGFYLSAIGRAYLYPQKSKRKYFYPYISLGFGFLFASSSYTSVIEPGGSSSNHLTKRLTQETKTKAFIIIPTASIGADFLFRQTAGFRMALGVGSGSQKDWDSTKDYKVVYDYLSPKITLGVFIFY